MILVKAMCSVQQKGKELRVFDEIVWLIIHGSGSLYFPCGREDVSRYLRFSLVEYKVQKV